MVSNHLPDKDDVATLLGAVLFDRLHTGMTFIISERGRTVNESELAETMRRRTDLTALWT